LTCSRHSSNATAGVERYVAEAGEHEGEARDGGLLA
jgi:hypothetical protein